MYEPGYPKAWREPTDWERSLLSTLCLNPDFLENETTSEAVIKRTPAIDELKNSS